MNAETPSRTPSFWLQAALLALGCGLSLHFYLANSRPQDRVLYVLLLALPTALLARLLWRGRPSRRGAWAVAFLIVFALVAPFGLLVNHVLRGVMCERQLLELQVAMDMYVADYGAFPPAAGWADALDGNRRDGRERIGYFVCPEPDWNTHHYAFNAALDGVRPDALVDPAHVVLFFETDHGSRNAAGGPELLPTRPRHRMGNYFVCVDRATLPHAYPQGREAGKLTWRPELQKPSPLVGPRPS